MTLEKAFERIKELEEENMQLKQKLEKYKNKNTSGRKKHNVAWLSSYNDFVIDFESGTSIVDIVAKGNISRRTAYRYKRYYEEIKNLEKRK